MDIYFHVLVLLFGTIIGSFLNVVILRIGTGMGLEGRSKCMTCAKKLPWYDLLPVASFFLLRGKCRSCKSKISWQYPLVEISTALLFLLVFIKYFNPNHSTSFLFVILYWFTSALLVVISVYDIKHKIIPDPLVFTLIGISAISLGLSFAFPELSFFNNYLEFKPGIWDILSAPILWAVPFASIWYFSKGKAMGFGDAKLAWAVAWFVGLKGGISAICLAFWIGAFFGIGAILYERINLLIKKGKKRGAGGAVDLLNMKSEVPFAPYIILGFILVFFFNADIINIVSKVMESF